ncbi:Alkaline ceramidase [Lachnellula subtilissima]|uniref:Alkaline ceramidase n=1 Tax=Lachnellula subtilissima TaxID=602034 RepID=A0A8H8RE38_9HELO|nr:Alkaline ceramidase [Lachnellula subtilissima]
MDYYKGNLATVERNQTSHGGNPFSFAYRKDPHPAFWGEVKSQANFCEEDYIITTYIAEFINTLSNLVYVYYAYHGIKSNANHKDAILRNLPYLGIATVGIGSGIFHASLKNYTQWADDLSMLLATATVLHRVFTFDKSIAYTVTYGAILSAAMTAFSTWHCVTDELIMHSVLFGVMIAAIGIKTRSIISARVSDPIVRADVKSLATWGAAIFVSGFVIWNIDTMACAHLTAIKRSIGMPWSFALELHGWWHLFTGLGAYIFIALVEYLTSEEAGQSLSARFAWPVAYIVTGKSGSGSGAGVKGDGDGEGNGLAKANGNGNGNGHANGATNGHANGTAKKNL